MTPPADGIKRRRAVALPGTLFIDAQQALDMVVMLTRTVRPSSQPQTRRPGRHPVVGTTRTAGTAYDIAGRGDADPRCWRSNWPIVSRDDEAYTYR